MKHLDNLVKEDLDVYVTAIKAVTSLQNSLFDYDKKEMISYIIIKLLKEEE